MYQALRVYGEKIHLEFDRSDYLCRCVMGKKVLHVGCSDFPVTEQRIKNGNLLHIGLTNSAKEVIGIDISDEGLACMAKYGIKNTFKMDAENISFDFRFEVILAGDVLEHLNNPGKFIERSFSLLDTNGELIVAVPNAMTVNNIKGWFLWEQVHKDHTFYFSPKTLSSLCSRYGLLPTKLIFTVQPPAPNESVAFILGRKLFLKAFKRMAPAFIMHFKKEVDKTVYFEWK